MTLGILLDTPGRETRATLVVNVMKCGYVRMSLNTPFVVPAYMQDIRDGSSSDIKRTPKEIIALTYF